MYNFDKTVDRKGTSTFKYDKLEEFFGRPDLLPMWVADMEFATPDFICRAIEERVKHPVYGYTHLPDGYFETIAAWVEKLHGWKVCPDHMRYIPGIVKGIGFAVDAFLKEGDGVIIQTPVYHPFRIVPSAKKCRMLYNPLVPVTENGRIITYRMDFDGLEKIIRETDAKMLILSNPHNPAGICWSRETLQRLAEITDRAGIIVISDEIHGEMALPGNAHVPYASVSENAAHNSITFMAPSKTFNIAGIVSSYVIVENPQMRERLFSYLEGGELDMADIFAPIATMAAYTEGDAWRREMLQYVQANVDFTDSFLRENIPGIKCVRPQASFLVWLDCRGLEMSQERLVSLFVDGARLALNDGSMFSSLLPDGTAGPEGRGFMRLNVGCPRSMLADALQRLAAALRA